MPFGQAIVLGQVVSLAGVVLVVLLVVRGQFSLFGFVGQDYSSIFHELVLAAGLIRHISTAVWSWSTHSEVIHSIVCNPWTVAQVITFP